jgi:hypothetical protein
MHEVFFVFKKVPANTLTKDSLPALETVPLLPRTALQAITDTKTINPLYIGD